MNYYYLSASLPSLSFDTKAPLSVKDFRAAAAEHLSSDDLEAITALDNIWESEPRSRFVREWKAKETSLRNALVKARAIHLKKESAAFLRETSAFDSDAERTASDAMSRSNPLEREQILDKYRWAALDVMAGFNPFSSDAILAYSLKLSISQRWSRMSSEEGARNAASVMETAMSHQKTGDEGSVISENNEITASKS